MPVIRNYESQVRSAGAIQTREATADDFGAGTARAVGQLAQGLSQVTTAIAKREEQQEVSDLTAKLTKANADLSIELQETIRTTKPGDKKPFEDYQKKMDDTLSSIETEIGSRGAKNYFNTTSATIRGQMNRVSAQGQADLAGLKAVMDYQDSRNNLSSALYADPSSLGVQMQMHKDGIQQLVDSGQLPASKAAELQADGEIFLNKTALRSWAKLDPEHAKAKLESGEFDKSLGAEGKIQMFGEIEQSIRAKEIEAERKRMQDERIKNEKQKNTQNDFLKKMSKNELTTQDILDSNLEAFGSGSKEQFLGMVKTQNSVDRAKTDVSVMIDLMNRINLPDGDPQKITDENQLNQFFGNGLSWSDLNNLRDEMQGRNTQEGQIEGDLKKQVLDIAKGQLTKSNSLTGLRDPIGDENYQRFMVYFLDEYKTQRKAGKSFRELLDPASKDYLGRSIESYVRTPNQIMQDMAKQLRAKPANGGLSQTPAGPPKPAPSARNPGESAADYLKRIKGKAE